MRKQQVRCSREIRSLTNELNQMRRELQTLQWSLVGVILLMIFLCLWMIRMRTSLNWHDDLLEWYICRENQRSIKPTRIFREGEAATTSVRVSNAVSSPPAQTARYRRRAGVTPTVPQETLVSCFHRSHQLLPGSNAVSVYLTFLDRRHHARWTHRTGPTFQQFRELQRMVQAGWAKLQRRQG